MTLVCSLTKIAMSVVSFLSGVGESHGGARSFEHGGLAGEHRLGDSGVGKDLSSLGGVGAVEADDDGCSQVDTTERLDDPLGHLFATGDAAEDVDEDALDVLVEVDDLEGGGHQVGV